MKYVILGLGILTIGLGIIRYSGILGFVTSIIGISIMMKGKKDLDNK